MDKTRLLRLAGLPAEVILTEAEQSGKVYQVVVAEYSIKKAFAELNGQFKDELMDGEFPEGSTFTIDMLTDQVMQAFVDAIAIVYDRGGSDDRRADNYGEAIHKILKSVVKK